MNDAEGLTAARIFFASLELQWGRAVNDAEGGLVDGGEPIFVLLQWGRAVNDAEGGALGAYLLERRGFNGAAP